MIARDGNGRSRAKDITSSDGGVRRSASTGQKEGRSLEEWSLHHRLGPCGSSWRPHLLLSRDVAFAAVDVHLETFGKLGGRSPPSADGSQILSSRHASSPSDSPEQTDITVSPSGRHDHRANFASTADFVLGPVLSFRGWACTALARKGA